MNDEYDDLDAAPSLRDPPDAKGLLPKTLHKALLTGVSAVLMTEEGIRNALGDMRLPKEAISYLVQQTERSRKDLFQSVSGEIKGFLSSVDFPGAIRKALTGLKIEVRADIRFVDDQSSEISVQTTLKDEEGKKSVDRDTIDASSARMTDGATSRPRKRTTRTTSKVTSRSRSKKAKSTQPKSGT